MQRPHAGRIGFERAELVPPNLADPGHPVRLTPPPQLGKTLQLALMRRHHHLAAAFRPNPVFRAKRIHPLRTLNRHPRLRRTRPVVQPGVNHPAVIPTLMPPNPRFLLQPQHPKPGVRTPKRHRRRKPKNPSPNHHNISVEARVSHRRPRAARRRAQSR